MEIQKGDVYETFADTSLLKELTNYTFKTNIGVGLRNFVKRYKNYHHY